MTHFPDNTMKICLKAITLHVHIGLLEHEMGQTQRILVNVALYTKAAPYLHHVTPETLINYNDIHTALEDWARRPHVLLIETYMRELLALCFENHAVEAAQVSITKPDIYKNVEEVGLEAFMTRATFEETLV